MKLEVPKVYLGTMTFAWSGQTSSVVDEAVALKMLKRFIQFDKDQGIHLHRVDTARVYAGGDTEPLVGKILKGIDDPSSVLLGTKAHPSVKNGLSPEGLKVQFETSLEELSVKKVEEYYLHQPDTENSLLESLKAAHSLVEEGKIHAIGMSNYHASEVARAFELCRENQLTPPTVYQGLYNPLNRLVEEDLLPILEKNGCSFVAYNPLAAGLLTGKHTSIEDVAAGRFKNNGNYLPRFYTAKNFEAAALIRDQCEKDGISMVEASYCWLLRHSKLAANRDGLLLGASSLDQLDENLVACQNSRDAEGGLSNELCAAFDKAWDLTKDGAFPYWRSYSSDMPDRDSLDPGASYNAAKTK